MHCLPAYQPPGRHVLLCCCCFDDMRSFLRAPKRARMLLSGGRLCSLLLGVVSRALVSHTFVLVWWQRDVRLYSFHREQRVRNAKCCDCTSSFDDDDDDSQYWQIIFFALFSGPPVLTFENSFRAVLSSQKHYVSWRIIDVRHAEIGAQVIWLSLKLFPIIHYTFNAV